MEYKCNKCNKYYKTYQTLWKHNKEFHNDKSIIKQPITTNQQLLTTNQQLLTTNQQPITTNQQPITNNQQPITTNNNLIDNIKHYNCKYCNKLYNIQQSKWKHEQKCTIINKNNIELDKEIENKKLEIILKKEEAKILQLKLKLQQADKVDNITLNKLNKMLLKHNNRIKNSFNNNTINNIQNVQNNFQLVGFGKEEITEVLTNNEKKLIMNSKYGCLEKLIEIVHCGKYNQFKNVILTNMKDNYMYKYDDTKGCFVLGTKSEIMNSLVDGKLFDLDVIYNDLLEKNKIDEKTKNCIEDFVNRIQYNDDKFTDIEGKEHPNYKHYKISEIKLLLFNNQDKITNDISLLLST